MRIVAAPQADDHPHLFTLYLSFFPLIFILLLTTLNYAVHDDPVEAGISLVVPTHADASCVAENKHGKRAANGEADMRGGGHGARVTMMTRS